MGIMAAAELSVPVVVPVGSTRLLTGLAPGEILLCLCGSLLTGGRWGVARRWVCAWSGDVCANARVTCGPECVRVSSPCPSRACIYLAYSRTRKNKNENA